MKRSKKNPKFPRVNSHAVNIDSSPLFPQPVSIEETYRLMPKSNFGSSSLADGIPQDAFPMVGVAINLKLDEPLTETRQDNPTLVDGVGDAGGGGGGGGGSGGGSSGGGGVIADPALSSTAVPPIPSTPSDVPVITIEDSICRGANEEGEEESVLVVSPNDGRKVDLMGGGDATSRIATQTDGNCKLSPVFFEQGPHA